MPRWQDRLHDHVTTVIRCHKGSMAGSCQPDHCAGSAQPTLKPWLFMDAYVWALKPTFFATTHTAVRGTPFTEWPPWFHS